MIGRPLGKLAIPVLMAGLLFLDTHAQSVAPNPLQQLERAAQGQQQSGMGNDQSGLSPTVIFQPTTRSNPQLPTSRIERILSARAGVKLTQFGYEQLGVGRPITIPQFGTVQDNYVLGPGDEIVVTLRGQENADYRTVVDRDGRVLLPRLNPVAAGGRTFADFRQDILAAIHRSYISTEGFISVGRVRQISVLVSGEVNSPGLRILNGLSSPVDAILVSGGIKKSGSLRNVYILRGTRRVPLDLYNVLTGHGDAMHVSLADGDRIVVPPLGSVAAIAGWIRRPGIYEIASGRSSIGAAELFALAGGPEVRGKYLISLLKVAPDGTNQLVPLDRTRGIIEDSEIALIQPGADQTVNKATLSGGTPLAGQYVTKNTKLSEILKAPGALGDSPYTLFGVISRRDPVTLLRVLIPFTPVAVLKGSEDMDVQSDDIVRILSVREAQMLFSTVREFEERRAQVDEALRNPQNEEGPVPGTTPGYSTTLGTNPYEAANTPQQNRQSSNGYNDARQDISTEMEAESLVYVERKLELAARKANGGLDRSFNAYPAQNQYAGPNPGGAQSPNGQQPSQFEQDGTQSFDQAGAQGVQNEMQQNPLYPMPSQLRSQGMTQQQIGPYRDSTASVEPPTLPQNLEEQSLAVGQVPTNQSVLKASQLARQMDVDAVAFVNFLRDHKVLVGGAVHQAGLYLVGPDADINSLLQAAGGLERWADKNSIEVIATTVDSSSGTSKTRRNVLTLASLNQSGYIVSPRDEVHVNRIFTDVGIGQVVVQGQVRNNGTYQIVRGEHLSELLARAGGLTDSAYPYGTVFLRRSVAALEKVAFRREADELETQLMIAMSRRDPNSKLSPDAFTALQGYVNQLRYQKALGRITVVADPAVLAANPSLDPLLETGDVVYIPQRPFAVSVLGEVLQPGSVPFKPGTSAAEYINGAGGYSQFADKSETFLVMPDGTARRIESSFLSLSFLNNQDVPPGSTIFVARDVSGVDMHQIILDSTAIFSQLATSAAALAVLSKQ